MPDIYSLFSAEVQGAVNVTTCEFGQQINGDLSATLRRNVTISGYIYNGSGSVSSPHLNFYTANVFNNFAAITLQTTVNIQSAPSAVWTFITATLDLSTIANITNGLMVSFIFPAGTLNDPSKYVLFSRLKLQIGEVATEFVDDTSLFIQTPSIDATMLQDGCIARPTLFGPQVIPSTAYIDGSVGTAALANGSVTAAKIAGTSTTLTAAFIQPAAAATVPIAVVSTTGFIAGQAITIAVGGAYTVASVTDATHMVVTNTGTAGNAAPAANVPTGGIVKLPSAVLASLGYTPINKAGDTGIGPGTLQFINDDVIGTASATGGAITVESSSANASNTGYMPALGFNRPGVKGRALGLGTTGRILAPIAGDATQYYLLDSFFKVANADIQAGSITYDKLAQSLINIVCPIGMVIPFAGVSPAGNWHVCDGAWISRTTYSVLFAQLGTYWGAGDGVNSFTLPNFINRVPVGYGSGASWGFGTYGGEPTHQLSIAEMPGHDHGWSQSPHDHGTHSHSLNPVPIGGGSGLQSGSGWLLGGSSTGASGVPAANANISFTGQGGWGAHNNMHALWRVVLAD